MVSRRRNSSASTSEQKPEQVTHTENHEKDEKDPSKPFETSERDEPHSPAPSCSSVRVSSTYFHKLSYLQGNDEDDDLPVGADFRTVLDEARKVAVNADTSLPPLNLCKFVSFYIYLLYVLSCTTV